MIPPKAKLKVTPCDESPYPSYRAELTGQEVLDLMNAGVIDIDPSYQRGKSAATKKNTSLPVHALRPSRMHIDSIKYDLATVTPAYNRDVAIIPQIWLNCRRSPGGLSYCSIDPLISNILHITGKLYCFDGWHRALAIKAGVRDGQVNPNRKYSFVILDAPLAFEARAFRILNSAGMPVKQARIAWVSAPFSHDLTRVAWDFATTTPGLAHNGMYNFETLKNTISKSSALYMSFLAISNGFSVPPNTNIPLWPQHEIDPASPGDRALVVSYMQKYWAKLMSIFPELGFQSPEKRAKSRAAYPTLLSNQAIQVLLWLGHDMLLMHQPMGPDGSYKTKLAELQVPGKIDPLLNCLEAIEPFFRNGQGAGDLIKNSTGNWMKNDFATRREILRRLKTLVAHSVSNHQTLQQNKD